MQGNHKIDVTKVANRIKLEEVKDFSSSLFQLQYENASECVDEIIEMNQKIDEVPREKRSYAMEISNVISFLGGRGTGKSSVMFSYAHFLKNYNKVRNSLEISEKDKRRFGLKNEASFLALDPIYASMLGNNEGVLEVVLAKMWDYYEQKEKEEGPWSDNVIEWKETIVRKFTELKMDYETYLQMAERTTITNIKQLHNLAGSINLRNTFQEVVSEFLKIFLEMPKKYLVITIDDIDMAGKNSFRILEQLHLFFCVPKIIILITADMERLQQVCNNNFIRTYLEKERLRSEEMDQSNIRMMEKFSNDYLGKIVASNLRINMPETFMLNLGVESDGKVIDVKKRMLQLLFKNGIDLDVYGDILSFFDESSLRENVNTLYELLRWDSTDTGKDKRQHIQNWMIKVIKERMLGKIESSALRKKANRVFQISPHNLNQYFVAIISEEMEQYVFRGFHNSDRPFSQYRNETLKRKNSLGEILYGCSRLEQLDYRYKDFVKFVIAYYTILIAKEEPDKRMNKFIKNAIWGSLLNDITGDDKNGIFNRIDIKGLELKMVVSADEVLQTGIVGGKDKNEIEIKKDDFVDLVIKLVKRNKKLIQTFQMLETFFDLSEYRINLEKKDFFEFSNGISVSEISGVKGLPKTEKEENDGEKKETTKYEIMISHIAKKSDFRIDYPLIYVDNVEIMSETFMEQFISGILHQLTEIIEREFSGQYGKKLKLSSKIIFSDIIKEISSEVQRHHNDIYMSTLIKKWKNENENKKNVFPINNVELIYNIGNQFKGMGPYPLNQFYDAIKSVYSVIGDELDKRDTFLKEIGIDKKYKKAYIEYPVVQMFLKDENKRELVRLLAKMIKLQDVARKLETAAAD